MNKRVFAFVFLLAASWVAKAETPSRWFEVRSPHFVVLTDSNEKQARKVAAQFERMRALFQTLLPSAGGDAGMPITVLALKDRKGFQSLEPAAYLAKGQLQLAGLFLRTQDRNYILLKLDAEGEHPFAVVYHEYTHFVLRKAEYLPLWLNEGLAEFYQNTDINEKDVNLGQPSAADILYLRQQRMLPLPVLFAVDHNSPYYHDEQKGSVFYSESWALTHMIEIADSANKTHRLSDYVHLVAGNEDPVSAAKKAFGDLDQLQKSLDRYVSNGDYKMFQLKSSFNADESSFQARPLTAVEANSVRADVLANDDRVPEAGALLETVLAEDPKNALAHETLGMIAYRAHDVATAKKNYAEAVQLDSKSPLAYFHYATLSMMAGATGDDDSIESSLRQAIKIDPGFAPAYDGLAQFYGMHQKNLEEARELMVKAQKLDPAELRYRLNAAWILSAEKKFDVALAVLEYAGAHIAKSPAETAEVQSRIAQLKDNRASYAQYQAVIASSGATPSSAPVATTTVYGPGGRVVEVDKKSEKVYPQALAAARHHTLKGILHEVKCEYPTVLTLKLDEAGKSIDLFSPDVYKVAFSTANYEPIKDFDPCKAMDGMKASVEYAEVTDKTLAGQVLSIQLYK